MPFHDVIHILGYLSGSTKPGWPYPGGSALARNWTPEMPNHAPTETASGPSRGFLPDSHHQWPSSLAVAAGYHE